MEKSYPIQLDFDKNYGTKRISYKAGDTNTILIDLYQSNVKFLTAGRTFVALAQCGTNKYNATLEVTGENSIKVTWENATSIAGTYTAEIQAYEGETRVTSQTFNYFVEDGIDISEAVETSTELPVLTQAIADVQAVQNGYTGVNGRTTALEEEVQTARGTYSSLDERLDNIGTGGSTGGDNVEASTTNGNIKVNGEEVQVYRHPANHDDRYYTETETDTKLGTKVDVVEGKGLSANDYTTAEKNKLAGLSNYIHPDTHSADIITDGTTNKAYTATEKTKLAGIADNANNYSHPGTHPASMITEDATHRFATDAEKTNWNNAKSKTDKISTYTSVSAVTNTYTLDLSSAENFAIETTDTNAKTIAFSNVPATAGLLLSISVKLKYTNAAAITYPTGITWQNASVPSFTAGKQYLLLFISYDNGTTWLASSVGAW